MIIAKTAQHRFDESDVARLIEYDGSDLPV